MGELWRNYGDVTAAWRGGCSVPCFVNKCNWSADGKDTEDSKKGTQSPASDQIRSVSAPSPAQPLPWPSLVVVMVLKSVCHSFPQYTEVRAASIGSP